MLKYDFKGFFKERAVHSDEWVSNGHFMFKKSILTAGQRKSIEKYPMTKDTVKQLMNTIDTAKKIFDDSRKHLEFTPDKVLEINNKNDIYNALYNSSLDLALREEYYNFFTSRNCKIFKGNGSINPALLFKYDEFVGILLPIRTSLEQLENATSYKDYITQLKQHHEATNELKKLNKKCLYISNNKAVVRNKPLKCISEITGDEKYKNIYATLPDVNRYSDIFIDLGIIYMSINKIIREDDIIEDTEHFLGNCVDITLGYYKNYIKESLNNNRWINVAEIKLMELVGESEELIESIHQHRENITKAREEKKKAEELQKQKEDQEYIDSKNKLVDDAITAAEQSILKGEKVSNKDITVYENRWTSNTTSLILHLMKLYNIKVPLKTQGWINKALHNITYNSEYGWSYHYYKSSSDSTVFMKYLKELVNKVEEKHKNVV